MSSLSIIKIEPCVEIGLQLLQTCVDLASKRAGVELVLNRLVQALADTVGLRALGFGSSVLNVLQVQVQRVLVVLAVAAVLAPAVSQDA